MENGDVGLILTYERAEVTEINDPNLVYQHYAVS